MDLNRNNILRGISGILLGLFVGLLTVLGQKYLPGSLNSLANSGAIWLVPAFFVASTAKTKGFAMFLCIETLIACVISYYWIESIVNHHSFAFSGYYFYLWLICAIIAGIIFGIGALFYRQKKSHYYWGASLLPAVFFSEGLIELVHLNDYMHMIPAVIGRIIIGFALYFIIYKNVFYKWRPLVSFYVLSALGMAGYELLFRLTS